jgi:hypothetical protein
MKRIVILPVILLLTLVFLSGCRKSNGQAEQIDYPETQTTDSSLSIDNATLPGESVLSNEEASTTEDKIPSATGAEDPSFSAMPSEISIPPEESMQPNTEPPVTDKNTTPNTENITPGQNQNTTPAGSKDDTPPKEEPSATGGENDMQNKDRLTKEEFLAYIENNNTGVRKDDFDNIDLDDFLDYTQLTAKYIGTSNIKKMLESYKTALKFMELEPYKSKEIVSVNSSDKDYDLFKKSFFGLLGTESEYIGKNDYLIETYYVTLNNERIRLCIGRTQNFGLCELYTFPDGTIGIRESPSDDSPYYHFCYSKNKKYFMFTTPSVDVNRAFCNVEG